ncbi:MAG: response regulator [Candidatus Rokubacteria bacterium]|nr:response regulator [Candidatus Rokubacteria bacterium]MBI4594644.1 response regulator [Candidatus Rokubacteria bacterium]
MKIITVDDSATMRRIIRNSLKAIGYTDVVEAENGQVGLAKIQTENVDFIITDWSMPVMTGLEMIHAIRGNPALKHLPILMVTAVGQKEEIVQAISAGVNGYIVKPFEAETLHAKMQQVLGKA